MALVYTVKEPIREPLKKSLKEPRRAHGTLRELGSSSFGIFALRFPGFLGDSHGKGRRKVGASSTSANSSSLSWVLALG